MLYKILEQKRLLACLLAQFTRLSKVFYFCCIFRHITSCNFCFFCVYEAAARDGMQKIFSIYKSQKLAMRLTCVCGCFTILHDDDDDKEVVKTALLHVQGVHKRVVFFLLILSVIIIHPMSLV